MTQIIPAQSLAGEWFRSRPGGSSTSTPPRTQLKQKRSLADFALALNMAHTNLVQTTSYGVMRFRSNKQIFIQEFVEHRPQRQALQSARSFRRCAVTRWAQLGARCTFASCSQSARSRNQDRNLCSLLDSLADLKPSLSGDVRKSLVDAQMAERPEVKAAKTSGDTGLLSAARTKVQKIKIEFGERGPV